MKKTYIYISLLAITFAVLAGCTLTDMELKTGSGIVTVMGTAAEFKGITVSTKAVEEDEKKVSEITMAIFDSDGNVVGRIVNIHASETNPVFVIDTKFRDNNGNLKPYILAGDETIYITNDQTLLNSCNIYMIANSWEYIPKNNEGIPTITKESELLQIQIPVNASNLTIPDNGFNGFPMIGKSGNIDLSADRSGATQMEDITMLKLYAKINVSIQINAENVITNPKFTLTGWKVSNVPTVVKLGEPANNEETIYANGDKSKLFESYESKVLSSGSLNISNSISLDNPDKMQFTFYIPEHRVIADNEIIYPDEINISTDTEHTIKQRYKPLLCSDGKNPLYVTINGIYTDHQNQMHTVTYTIYLGQDSYSDFCVNRNQQLNNIVTIKGVTNNNPGFDEDGKPIFNISADYRVEVESNGNYVVKVERDALLDSHFEVRPLDVYINGGGTVKISVVDASSTDATDKYRIWLRMENGGTGDDYIGTKGVRKYFTTDLVTNTLKNNTTIEINSNDANSTLQERIWLYFDENPNVFDRTEPNNDELNKQYRDITIRLEYYNPNGTKDDSQTRNITFRQMNLWRLWSYTDETKTTKKRFYDIEYHEEYLNNYASDQPFGQTTDGLPWGLNGLSLSKHYEATDLGNTGTGWWDYILDIFGASLSPYYDYSLDTDRNYLEQIDKFKDIDIATTHEFAGLNFTKQIAYIGEISSKMKDMTLNVSAETAIQYCLNKNKRNSNGEIPINNDNTPNYASDYVHWYLPSIDEIQEIVVAGYQDFEVFQNKFYWSSQPAYEIASVYQYSDLWGRENTLKGYMLQENNEYARATSAVYNDGWTFKKNGIRGESYHHQLVYFLGTYDKNNSHEIEVSNDLIDEGYMPRSNVNRIRCIRNSGTYQ